MPRFMCMGVPMEVVEVRELEATVRARGVERVVSTLLLYPDGLAPGDHVVVHLGQAIERVTAEQARDAWAALEELFGDEFPMSLGAIEEGGVA